MRQWEIYDFPVPNATQPHPCVIISPDPIFQNPAYEKVNVLMCVSLRGRDQAKPREVRLNGADGLDGPTIAKCHIFLYEEKASAGALRGKVTPARRKAIQRTIQDAFGLFAD